MLKLFDKLKELIKEPDILTDSLLFRIHCKYTAIALFGFLSVATAIPWVGEAIQCLDGSDKEIPKAVTTLCWIQSKYTMADSASRALIDGDYDEKRRYYPYYQWVSCALSAQIIFCYLPKYFWQAHEKNLLQQLVMGLNKSLPNQVEIEEKKRNLLRYLLSHAKMHKVYVFKYWFYESLCLVNVLGQIVFMNAFLGGEFLGYGWEVLSFMNQVQEDRIDPMIYLFPRMTKCEFLKYGPSGTLMNTDVMCLLPINSINEKIYVAIWFWYMMLAPLLLLLMVFRLLISGWVKLRVLLLKGSNPLITRKTAETICSWADVGDFWIVFSLSSNIHFYLFNDILERLVVEINTPCVRKETISSSLEKPQGGKGDCVLNVGYDKYKPV